VAPELQSGDRRDVSPLQMHLAHRLERSPLMPYRADDPIVLVSQHLTRRLVRVIRTELLDRQHPAAIVQPVALSGRSARRRLESPAAWQPEAFVPETVRPM
jgi:hypothetical protein